MKVDIVIKHTQTARVEIGELPAGLVRDLLAKNEGTFDGNWTLGDVKQTNEKWVVDSIEVTEVGK